MITQAPCALKVVAYIAAVAVSFWLGRVVGDALTYRLAAYPSASFLLVFVAALAAVLGVYLENKYVWAGWFKSSAEEGGNEGQIPINWKDNSHPDQ